MEEELEKDEEAENDIEEDGPEEEHLTEEEAYKNIQEELKKQQMFEEWLLRH